MDPKLLLSFYQALIVKALDSGDTDRLRRLIAQVADLQERIRRIEIESLPEAA